MSVNSEKGAADDTMSIQYTRVSHGQERLQQPTYALPVHRLRVRVLQRLHGAMTAPEPRISRVPRGWGRHDRKYACCAGVRWSISVRGKPIFRVTMGDAFGLVMTNTWTARMYRSQPSTAQRSVAEDSPSSAAALHSGGVTARTSRLVNGATNFASRSRGAEPRRSCEGTTRERI